MTTRSPLESPVFPDPPHAKVIPHRLERHGQVRVDDYYWLNDRTSPDVLAYLQEENDYATALRRHTADLEHALFEEIKGRIKQTDLSVPFKQGDYVYYVRYEEGKEYALYCRKKGYFDTLVHVLVFYNDHVLRQLISLCHLWFFNFYSNPIFNPLTSSWTYFTL